MECGCESIEWTPLVEEQIKGMNDGVFDKLNDDIFDNPYHGIDTLLCFDMFNSVSIDHWMMAVHK